MNGTRPATDTVGSIPRRDFLAGATALCATCTTAPGALLAGCTMKRRLENIGIQLYTVRDRMAEDVPDTLQRLAEIGYREVEFAGYFDHTPAEIRKLLSDLGLTAPSAHAPIELLRADPEQAIETCLAIGHKYLVMPWLAEKKLVDKSRN